MVALGLPRGDCVNGERRLSVHSSSYAADGIHPSNLSSRTNCTGAPCDAARCPIKRAPVDLGESLPELTLKAILWLSLAVVDPGRNAFQGAGVKEEER